jgi:hypothetical protein
MEVRLTNSTTFSPLKFREAVSKLPHYPLSGRAEIALKDFDKYGGEKVVDLSGGTFHFVPEWITSKFPKIEVLIISGNRSRFDVFFERGFNKKVAIIADKMRLKHPFEGFDPEKVLCETDFTSIEYDEQFTQGNEEFIPGDEPMLFKLKLDEPEKKSK